MNSRTPPPDDDPDATPLERPPRLRSVSTAISQWLLVETWLASDKTHRIGGYVDDKGFVVFAHSVPDGLGRLEKWGVERVQPNEDPTSALCRAITRWKQAP